MSPVETVTTVAAAGPPRASGDEPTYDIVTVALGTSAPRERG